MGCMYLSQRSRHLLTRVNQYSQRCFHRNYRVLFFGSDDFSVPHLESLIFKKSSKLSHLQVVSSSKSTSVYNLASKHSIPILMWEEIKLKSTPLPPFDFGVVASFGHFIPKWLVKHFSKALINVHPSLLPRWRGPAPIVFSLLRLDRETGVTLIEIDPESTKFDNGLILSQRQYPNSFADQSRAELTYNLAQLGSQLMLEILNDFEFYHNQSKPQSKIGISSSCRIRREMGRINWNKMNRDDIDALHRSVSDIVPIMTQYSSYPVKLVSRVPLDIVDEAVAQCNPPHPVQPGWIFFSKLCRNILLVSCADGRWVGYHNIVLKRPLSAVDFYNGYLAKPSSIYHFTSLDNPLYE